MQQMQLQTLGALQGSGLRAGGFSAQGNCKGFDAIRGSLKGSFKGSYMGSVRVPLRVPIRLL